MFNSPWIRKPDFKDIQNIDYDKYWEHRGWQLNKSLKPREKIMLEMIPAGSKVLDIGCGNSLLAVKLKEKGCDVLVSDVSSVVLEQYKKLGIDSLRLDLRKPQDFALPGSYDYIILSEVLEHLDNPEQVVSTFKKYTKYFLITVPNSASYQFRFGLTFKGRFFTQWIYHPSEHLRFWSHIDFMDWLRAMDLEVLSSPVSEGFSLRGFVPWLPSLWKNLLGYRMVYLCNNKSFGFLERRC